METWQFVAAMATFVITVFAAVAGSTWRFAWQLASIRDALLKQFADKIESINTQLISINNSMLTRLQLAEDNIDARISQVVDKFDARTLEIERDLATFKAYSERQFVSKETFNVVMQGQSAERRSMKADLMDRLNRIDRRLPGGGE